MAVLKSYTCSKCGGVLVFDDDHSYFDCPFCGTRFSSADFHEDELLSQAEECLKCKEFESARQKYRDILVNDPHNFYALRGLVLSAAGVSSIADLEDPANLENSDFTQVNNELTVALNHASSEDAAYFDKFLELIESAGELKRLNKEFKYITSPMYKKKGKESGALGELGCFIEFILVPGLILDIPVFIAFVVSGISPVIPLVIFFALLIALGIEIARSNKQSEDLQKRKDEKADAVRSRTGRIDQKKQETAEQYSALFTKLKEYEPKTDEVQTSKDSVGEEAAESQAQADTAGGEPATDNAAEEASVDEAKTIVCDKCGANLSLDKIKRVYACNSCGVAYGVSLFFAHPLEKALNAMNSGYYAEAEERFAHVLMVNPTDFEARLGRILSAGRWSKVSDIKVFRGVNYINVNRAKMQIKEAIRHTRLSDAKYMLKLQETMEVVGEIALNKKRQVTAENKLLACEVRVDLNSGLTSDTDGTDEQGLKEAQNELDECRKKALKLEKELVALKKELLEMRNDSVLTR